MNFANIWAAIKQCLIELIGSQKVMTVVLGGLSMLAIKYLMLDQATADQISQGIMTIVVVLLGAQGLTDLGKGDNGQPLTIAQALEKSVVGLLGSKKFMTALAGGIVWVLVKLNVNSALATNISTGLLTVVSTLIGAQGLLDLGKAANTSTAVADTSATPPAPPAAS